MGISKKRKDPVAENARIQRELNKIGQTPHQRWVQERSFELIEQAGGLEKVPKSMRGVIKKSKRFSHISEKP